MPAILHTYCLVLPEDDSGQQRRIEFEALDPGRAIYLAQQLAPGRNIELREDERPLGIIRHAHEGFWLLWSAPPNAA